MKCIKCKKDCLESELENGLCYECRNKYRIIDNVDTVNFVAQGFKIFSIIEVFIGIILSIILLVNDYDIIYTIICIAASIIVFAFSRAIAEIIQLLEDIKNK